MDRIKFCPVCEDERPVQKVQDEELFADNKPHDCCGICHHPMEVIPVEQVVTL